MPKSRILAVDDQLYFRVFLEDLLGGAGYGVDTAATGEEALTRLEAAAYDLVLTDLIMPGMDGIELVQRVRERLPDQEIVVVTSVADVATAVEAIKLGATDYLLKPIDRAALLRSVDTVLRQRRIRDEHQRLMAENLEFMGVFSLYERAAGLFATLALEPLSERVAEALCLETGAQGAVVWLRGEDGSVLRLAAARGIVRPEKERDEIPLDRPPAELAGLGALESRPFCGLEEEAEARPLFVPLMAAGEVQGLARLTDKLGGDEFASRDLAASEKLAQFAGLAIANARRFRALERRSFRDAATGAYTSTYLEDVARHELAKASRFGRTFSLLRLELEETGDPPERPSQGGLAQALEGLTQRIAGSLRAADLLAVDPEQSFLVLLPETDALGATLLKRRLLELARPEEGLQLVAGAASYPGDGLCAEALLHVLEGRIAEHRRSAVRELAVRCNGFAQLTASLLDQARLCQPSLPEQVARLLLRDVAARPTERGLLFLAPGTSMVRALQDELEGLRGLELRTQVVLVGEAQATPGLPVAWASPGRVGPAAAFLLYCGADRAYALLQQPAAGEGEPALFHTQDRPLVEHLTLELGRELGLAIGV